MRIAPSPTGFFHIGTARTALYNYLFARAQGGAFILRIEDTDKERGSAEYEEDIHTQMQWLGIVPDETYIQSEHVATHTKQLQKLVDTGSAYVSREPAKDDPTRQVEVVRLRNPGKTITFTDAIRGEITFDTTELKDFVIARSLTDPLYHFAVVADDGDAGITHVIRGEDHISNTPRQILIQEALGLPCPAYAHLPLILAPDRTKMSKRKHQTSIRDFRARGYLPEAMVNFIALLGWSEGEGDKELYSMKELIDAFSLEKIHSAGAIFNEEKLRWFNREYLLRIPEELFAREALTRLKESLPSDVSWNEGVAMRIVPILRERIHIWDDINALARDGEFEYFFRAPSLEPSRIADKKSTPEDAAKHLKHTLSVLATISDEDFIAERIKDALWDYATAEGRGAALWPIRYALSGKDKSPDPFTLAQAIGKGETEQRLRAARALIS
ncbi:MAG: glutamate--tRNA ligase [Methylomonas sp.]|nr:glutamate--tRNA ligase [Methylomonas sp.]